MGKVSVNRSNLLAVRLLELRRHLSTCWGCRAALKNASFELLCKETVADILFIAQKWDSNITARLAVRRRGEELQFLCPDPNAHGAAYAATAEPVIVTGTMQALF